MRIMPTVVACLLIAPPGGKVTAHDLLGLYVGGAIGQGRVDATAPYFFGQNHFRENHTAFKAIVGVRPIPLLGAEFAYVDFGHPDRRNGIVSTDVRMKGAAAFGLLHAPLPIIDLYAKVGVARLQSTVTTFIECPEPFFCPAITAPAPTSRTDTAFAAGGGAQFKLGSLTLRAEYERFQAAGGHPSLLSIGATWTFL
ncbi:MAG: hypothetical protein ACJ8R9_22150 [Steroidobacteraceae bacterium]